MSHEIKKKMYLMIVKLSQESLHNLTKKNIFVNIMMQ